MKIIIYMLALLSFFSYSEEVCWEVTPADKEATVTEISQPSALTKIVCLDFDDALDNIVINQGGGCGGSSKCGFNFLILDDLIYQFNKKVDEFPLKTNSINLGPINFHRKYNIFTKVEDAQLFIKQRLSIESVMYSKNLRAAINSWEGYNSPKKAQNSLLDIFRETRKGLKLKEKPHSNLLIEQFELNEAQIIQINNLKN
ncbi:hypothetical protein AMS58_19355 [Pseudoalteromonas porphyrae]|uniref:hypothetical protein n=1 Tax=Pseudoalteromonas porphyrae TaxID=187330 RepID=UPI0006BB0DA6|nr:hypothetical protein [Pseudoalteromonas porphyrae]KPH93085.1 hypothetical protein AMS58_19355 [Pseudoalteromonas porphyrae]